MMKKDFFISGMTCGSCAMKIEQAIKSMPGIKYAHVDFSKRRLQIESEYEIVLQEFQDVASSLGAYAVSEKEHVVSKVNSDTLSVLVWCIFGLLGIAVVFYLVQALGMQSWDAPIFFTIDQWYFVFPLIIAFGIQMGFFRAIHLKQKYGGGGAMATSGTVSTGAMIACCVHNLALLFPVLGLSGLAAIFAAYQPHIFFGSILVAIVGIIYMWKKYRKIHKYCHEYET